MLSLWKHVYSNILKYKISDKTFWYFSYFFSKYRLWYSLEPPQRGGSNEYPQSLFLSRNKKNNVYPCKPQFYYIKVGFTGSKLYRRVFVMVLKYLPSNICLSYVCSVWDTVWIAGTYVDFLYLSLMYSWLSLSRPGLSRITAYLEVEIWSLPIHENLTTDGKYCRKEEKLLLRSNFSSFPQYFQYISNFKSPITYQFVKCG